MMVCSLLMAAGLLLGLFALPFRSRLSLQQAALGLRHQLTVYQRSRAKPHLKPASWGLRGQCPSNGPADWGGTAGEVCRRRVNGGLMGDHYRKAAWLPDQHIGDPLRRPRRGNGARSLVP